MAFNQRKSRHWKDFYEEFIDNIITVSQKNPMAQYDLTSVIQLTQDIKNSSPNGRVVIDLLDEVSSESLVLKDGDSLTIPEKQDHSRYVAIIAIIDPCLRSTVLHSD